jgi:hypothetical protein
LKKIQQFYIYKISSGRLKESKYNIKQLNFPDAKLNGEVISISSSQMVRTIFNITNKKFSQIVLDELWNEKKKLTKQKNKKENRIKLKSILEKINDLLFIPDLISISFDNKKHFLDITKKGGFLVNGITYIPFMASAGMIRRDLALYINKDIFERIEIILNNGRNKSTPIVPAKFLSYYSLYSSSSIPVTFPKIAVVKDCIIKTRRRVDFSTYQGIGIDPLIEEKEMELELNGFDGQGLCSPEYALELQADLNLDYIPSVVGIRAPFIKGMVCVFDFKQYAQENNVTTFTDIYGELVNVDEVDCIISESQFKLWDAYHSTQEYVDKCLENNLDFGITKVNPKEEKNHAKTSYQFLQVLNLTNEQIESLCKPTLDWIESVSGKELESVLLYLLGENHFEEGWFNQLDYPIRSLLIENKLLQDKFINNYLDRSIEKKKKDAKIGRLILEGNYQIAIADPYAFCGHVFFGNPLPLLNNGQHYSYYWNKKNISQVACIRSPIVHSSEVNVLNLQNNELTQKWYKYIHSGIIFPANGIGMDASINGGMDFDLDLVCTLNSPEIIQGRIEGLPVLYNTQKAEKITLDENYYTKLNDSHYPQIKTNKIGFLTNVSSSFYVLLNEFEPNSKEYEAILNRLKYGRVSQGLAIDSTKGLIVDPFPEHFTKWRKIKEEMLAEEKEKITFYNSILADRRPVFMIHLYSHYYKRYWDEMNRFNNISFTKWGIPFDKLIKMDNLSEEQKELIKKYKKKSFFLNNSSTMNRIFYYVEEKLKEIKKNNSVSSENFDYFVLLSRSFQKPNRYVVDKIRLLYKQWKSLNQNFREDNSELDSRKYESLEMISKSINEKAYNTISTNQEQLVNWIIYACYGVLGVQARTFAWRCFGEEIFENIKSKNNKKFVRVPIRKSGGSISYLWSEYENYLLNVGEI